MANKTMGMGELPALVLDEEDPDPKSIDVNLDDDQPIPEDDAYTENEDGSVDVEFKQDEKPGKGDFDENLAESLDESFLNSLGTEYIDLIDQDIEAREKRDAMYAEGIKRTGMGGEAPGGAEFEGASRAVHPMLTKACVDFASRAIKELFPATGPCKTQIIGDQTEAKLDRADRKKKYMNWQSTTQVAENRSELEKLLSQVPLGGAQYKRWWWDPELARSRTEAVFIDDVFTPYGHSDFYTSPRVTHRQKIMRGEYERRIRTELYRDLSLSDAGMLVNTDDSKSVTATNKIEGVDPDASSYNADGLRIVYQVDAQLELEDDPHMEGGLSAPYVIHIDKQSKRVLGLYRNWKEKDERKRKKHWMTEWPMIPWRGGPAVGLAHIIGSLSGAATGALRAIIDAAQIQNFPGGLKLRGGKQSGQSIQVNATELAEIDAPAGTVDPDIRKLVMPFPFNGPSAVLFQTLEWLTQQAEAVVSTASETIADAGADMPVGTAMALIEHGSANFSAIHARLHNAMKHDLEILHRLNSEHLSDRETVEDLGELVVSRSDFEGPMDIIPVSDPNIFSEAQRYAQLQAVLQLKADPQFASYFKPDQLLARALKLLQIPDIDGIANLPKDSKKLEAMEENYVVSSSEEQRPLKVYEAQDDLTHLKLHIQYCTSPMFGANPLIAAGIMAKMLQHCKEHLLQLYKKHSEAAVAAARMVVKAQGMEMSEEDIVIKGAAFAEHMMATLLAPQIMPGLQQMQKAASQIAQSAYPQAIQADANTKLQEQTKEQIAGLMAKQKSDDAERDRQQAAAAAALTARIEQAQQESQESIAQLTSQLEMALAQQDQAAKQLMAEFEASKDTQRLVLQEVLTAAFEPAKPVPGPIGPDGKPGPATIATDGRDLAMHLLQPLLGLVNESVADALQGLNSSELTGTLAALAQQQQGLEAMLTNTQQGNAAAFEQLARTVAGLQQSQQQRQEMHAEIFTGPDGVRRARLVPSGPSGPQQQAPNLQ